MELYLNTFGSALRKKDDMFEVFVEGNKTRLSPQKISSIVITNAVQISSDAIQMAMEYNIDVVFLDKYGSPYARVWFPKIGSTVLIRRRQLEMLNDACGLDFIRNWICVKIMNQFRFLKLLISKRDRARDEFDECLANMRSYALSIGTAEGDLVELGPSFMGWEGSASRCYFQALAALIPQEHSFRGRSSHPAKDAFNAFLNYGYGILYSKVERALIIAGLDPYIGLLHTDNYNKKSFVFDFIEPYRHFVDEPVFYIFSRRKFSTDYIEAVHEGVMLSTAGKKFFAPLLLEHFDTKMRYHNKNRRLIECIQSDAHAFANCAIGKRDSYLDVSTSTSLKNFLAGSVVDEEE
jgi:CRISPR-associated protein Cas1